MKNLKKGLFALGLAGLLALMPMKGKTQDKKFRVGAIYEVGQPAYTSLKQLNVNKDAEMRQYLPNWKPLTNPGLLNMLGAEASVKLTKNLNLIGSFSTSIGNEWKYDETYNSNNYKNIISNEKADILEGKLGLEGSIQAGNWSFSAGGGVIWNNVNYSLDRTTNCLDGNWIKRDINTCGNACGYLLRAKVDYEFSENCKGGIGVSYENNTTTTSGNEVGSTSQGLSWKDPKNIPFELERTNFTGSFNFFF